jgi:hypothetical protein
MSLTFITAYEPFSVYRHDDGSHVYIKHGGMARWTSKWDHNLYNTLKGEMDLPDEAFIEFVRATCTTHFGIAYYPFQICDDCDDVSIDCESVRDGARTVCETCREGAYWYCDACCDYWTSSNWIDVADVAYCDDCYADLTSYCAECGVRYLDDDADAHSHNDGCNCEAPGQTFTVHNNGDGTLPNDTRATITLPAGQISSEGMQAIRTYLHMHPDLDLSYVALATVGELEATWQTKEGNFTKRLSRALHKLDGTKLPSDVMSMVGNIARDHSAPVAHSIEVTRNLNLSAEEFGHEDSCWWQSYYESRCALKSNGGYGMRAFGGDDYVVGRAWVMPMRKTPLGLRPTFDTLNADAFVVFNGYGTLSGYTATRVIAHMEGMTYRKIRLQISPMYVNGDAGYLIASEEIASRYTDGSLSLTLEDHSTLFSTENATRKELAHV